MAIKSLMMTLMFSLLYLTMPSLSEAITRPDPQVIANIGSVAGVTDPDSNETVAAALESGYLNVVMSCYDGVSTTTDVLLVQGDDEKTAAL